jgi:hypothetical protein
MVYRTLEREMAKDQIPLHIMKSIKQNSEHLAKIRLATITNIQINTIL